MMRCEQHRLRSAFEIMRLPLKSNKPFVSLLTAYRPDLDFSHRERGGAFHSKHDGIKSGLLNANHIITSWDTPLQDLFGFPHLQ